MATPASAAYARMGSDSGHQVRSFYPWALDDVALKNHAFEANHLTLDVGTQVVTQFYGKAPTRRYMLGQSNGGRSGLVAAQRYPNDYDGIIAIEPAMFQQAHQVNLGATTMKHIYSSPRELARHDAKVALFAKAEIAACDELDGLKDGIIANIAACTYIPTDLQCKGADNDACLTAGQIETIRMVYTRSERSGDAGGRIDRLSALRSRRRGNDRLARISVRHELRGARRVQLHRSGRKRRK